MGIDFTSQSTRMVAIELYNRMIEKNSRYQNLVLGTGQGKTAIGVATAGLFAVRFKQDINVFVIAPRSKIDEASWNWTIDEYNKIAKYKLNLIEATTPDMLTVAKKNDKLLKREIKAMPPSKQKKLKFLKQWYKQSVKKPTVFLIDESHNFKNPTSKRSKALQQLIKGGIGVGLTATPMTNGMLQDGVAYLIYNGYYNSQQDFRNQHIPPMNYNKFHQPDVFLENGDIDPNRFYELERFEFEVSETNFAPQVPIDFDMPQSDEYSLSYDLSNETIIKMKQFHKDYRKRRYDSYMKYLSDLRNAIGSDMNHRRMLARILLSKKPQQPLIFYYTDAEYESIVFTLEKLGMRYSKLNGHSDSDTMATIDQNDTEQAIVIQYKSGGTGNEFKNSHMSIFYGLQYSWGETEQAMGRNMRRGMPKDLIVEQIFLVATNPHDAKVFNALQNKQKFTEKFKEAIAEEIMTASLE